MYSAFSTKIFETYTLLQQTKLRDNKWTLPEETTVREVVSKIPIDVFSELPYAILGPSVLNRELSDGDRELVYKICTVPGVRSLLRWINKNIFAYYANHRNEYKTVNVRLRIATGMLNILFTTGALPEHYARLIHDNFTFNFKDWQNDILDEDLPF